MATTEQGYNKELFYYYCSCYNHTTWFLVANTIIVIISSLKWGLNNRSISKILDLTLFKSCWHWEEESGGDTGNRVPGPWGRVMALVRKFRWGNVWSRVWGQEGNEHGEGKRNSSSDIQRGAAPWAGVVSSFWILIWQLATQAEWRYDGPRVEMEALHVWDPPEGSIRLIPQPLMPSQQNTPLAPLDQR